MNDAQQLGQTDGGGLVMDRYGHPSEAKARERNLALWEVSGAIREQETAETA